MSLTFFLKSFKLSNSFINGTTPLSTLSKPTSSLPLSSPRFLPVIKALKTLQGRVICATNDKTVSVEVVRIAPHPSYKRRIRKKKKYQAHDEDNVFKAGDMVRLEKSRPISNTRSFVALPVPKRNVKKKDGEEKELGIPLKSEQA